MTVERRWHPHGLRRLFQHVAPDVVGLLVTQGEISAAATSEFLEWSRGSGDAATLTALEHEA
ncbi:MAG: hypothetical protein ACYCU6_06395, partial [Acidimicrobiales bacterium]